MTVNTANEATGFNIGLNMTRMFTGDETTVQGTRIGVIPSEIARDAENKTGQLFRPRVAALSAGLVVYHALSLVATVGRLALRILSLSKVLISDYKCYELKTRLKLIGGSFAHIGLTLIHIAASALSVIGGLIAPRFTLENIHLNLFEADRSLHVWENKQNQRLRRIGVVRPLEGLRRNLFLKYANAQVAIGWHDSVAESLDLSHSPHGLSTSKTRLMKLDCPHFMS